MVGSHVRNQIEDGASERDPEDGEGFAGQGHETKTALRMLALDPVIDGPDPQAACGEPSRPRAGERHRLGDDRIRLPVEGHTGAAGTGEEVGVAAAEEIVARVEGWSSHQREGAPRNQAIAAAVDHRNRPAFVIGGGEGGVVVEAGPCSRFEARDHRAADDADPRALRRGHHALQPVGLCQLVVVDHQEITGVGIGREGSGEGPIDRRAIALALLDHALALERSLREHRLGGHQAGLRRAVVVHHHDGEAEAGPLARQGGEGLDEVLRPFEGRDADHRVERIGARFHDALPVKRSITVISGLGLRSESRGSGRFAVPSGRVKYIGTQV